MKSVKMVEVTRSGELESFHQGIAVLINSSGDVLKEWGDAQRAWYVAQQELYVKYKAFETFGGEKFVKAAKKQLKERAPAGVDGQRFSKNLAKGVFTPWEMPDSYKDNYLKIKREKNLDREWPKEELRTRYRYLKNQDISLMSSPRLEVPWED